MIHIATDTILANPATLLSLFLHGSGSSSGNLHLRCIGGDRMFHSIWRRPCVRHRGARATAWPLPVKHRHRVAVPVRSAEPARKGPAH